MQSVSYRGIFSAEFKRDSVTGEFKILEVNTRPWVYVEFAAVCGMNMCELHIEDALRGMARTLPTYAIGIGCVNLYNDIVAVVEMPREQRPKGLALLWCWSRSFKLFFFLARSMAGRAVH